MVKKSKTFAETLRGALLPMPIKPVIQPRPQEKPTSAQQPEQQPEQPRITETTLTQEKATKQGVPLEAFKTETEDKKQFRERVEAEPLISPTLTAEAIKTKRARISQNISELGQQAQPTEKINQEVNAGGTLLEAGQVLGAAATGAGVGAIPALSVPTAGLSIIAGGVIGAGGEILRQIIGDKRQITTNAGEVFTRSQARYPDILNMANSGMFTPSEVVLNYNENLANAREAERVLTSLINTKTGTGYKKAEDELASVRAWLQLENERRNEMALALSNPNHSKRVQTITQPFKIEDDGGLF